MERATLKIWDDDACARVHAATLRVLREVGVEMKHDAARTLCARTARASTARAHSSLARWSPRRCAPHRGASACAPRRRHAAARPHTGRDLLRHRTRLPLRERPADRRAPARDARRRGGSARRSPSVCRTSISSCPWRCPRTPPRDIRRPRAVRGDAGAHAQADRRLEPVRRRARWRVMKEMAATCGEARSLACLAMTSPPLHARRGRLRQDHDLRRAGRTAGPRRLSRRRAPPLRPLSPPSPPWATPRCSPASSSTRSPPRRAVRVRGELRRDQHADLRRRLQRSRHLPRKPGA